MEQAALAWITGTPGSNCYLHQYNDHPGLSFSARCLPPVRRPLGGPCVHRGAPVHQAVPRLSHHSDSRGQVLKDSQRHLHLADVFPPLYTAATICFISERHQSLWCMQIQSCRHSFSLRVTGEEPATDWAIITLSLYAELFMAQSQRKNSCRYCCSLDHTSFNGLRSGCSHFFSTAATPALSRTLGRGHSSFQTRATLLKLLQC